MNKALETMFSVLLSPSLFYIAKCNSQNDYSEPGKIINDFFFHLRHRKGEILTMHRTALWLSQCDCSLREATYNSFLC